MIFRSNDVPKPKNGSIYRVLAICRISTEHQDEMSLEDQLSLYESGLQQNLEGQFEIESISSRGSGEDIQRSSFTELFDHVDSGDFDIVIAEDLRRIARRVHAMLVCEAAEDSDTRVVAINDFVDTLDENWRQSAFFATARHESYNADTSRRIKRSLRNRFTQGGIVQTLLAGYVKPHPKATDDECYKDPDAEPVYDEWFDRLERGQTFAEIADWLNSIGFPTGPAAKHETWTGTLVGDTTYNPLLMGVRIRNRKMSKRVNKTGKRKSVDAPKEDLLTREVPHLAFIEPERYMRVVEMVRKRNVKYRSTKDGRPDERKSRARLDTRWPGCHLRCGICGRKFVFNGHGRKDRLACSGAADYRCWNAVTIDGLSLATKAAERELPNRNQHWTGAEIKACCRLAVLLDIPTAEAAEHIVPVAVTEPNLSTDLEPIW